MRTFAEQLRLAEKAAEDIYFAKVDRELLESLHKQRHAEAASFEPSCCADALAEGFGGTAFDTTSNLQALTRLFYQQIK
jgi:hypothetical protein